MHPYIAECTASLQATPACLLSWLPPLPPDAWHRKEKTDAWSTIDIIRHLIFGEQTDWIPRLQLMLDQQDGKMPTFTPFDRSGHEQLPPADMLSLIKQFATLRAGNIAVLHAFELTDKSMGIQAMHPELGLVTVRQLLSAWVVHDYTHLYQICRNLSSQYVDAVGPWFDYMKILKQNF